MTTWNEEGRQAALKADDAWSAELRRLFGKNAGDVRYLPAGKGEEGTKLRALHDEFRRATDTWQATIRYVL